MNSHEKFNEIKDEIKEFFFSREGLWESVIPPVVYVIVAIFAEPIVAAGSGVVIAVIIGLINVLKGDSVLYSFFGVLGVLAAFALAYFSGDSEVFFAPGIIQSFGIAAVALISLLVKRPMVALTSLLVRRWPLKWYLHEKVLPAYMEVTGIWVLYFFLEGVLGVALFVTGEDIWLAVSRIVTGLPATIALLVVSYIYGTWRLQKLGGPSVEEFETRKKPPWAGQKKGF